MENDYLMLIVGFSCGAGLATAIISYLAVMWTGEFDDSSDAHCVLCFIIYFLIWPMLLGAWLFDNTQTKDIPHE